MVCSEIIKKKRDRERLSNEEIEFIVRGAADGTLPDYQISAWLMACFLNGLDFDETLTLTRAMKESGESLEWRKLHPPFANEFFVDKHSTGGVGDKVSLVLAPLVACLGLKVPMMSGRGLGFTGGTVDKLESIPGFSMYPNHDQMIASLDQVGAVMMAQASTLCPADKKLYALRDVTATVENYSLITASIVSKKWAEGVDAIVFDVKCGAAAFMPTLEQAQTLSRWLVRVATMAGMKARACITRMEEPLGAFIGNALEVRESVFILRNSYPSPTHERLAKPLRDLCVRLAAEMFLLSDPDAELAVVIDRCEKLLDSGAVLEKFLKMCEQQGAYADWPTRLPSTDNVVEFKSPQAGYVSRVHSKTLGLMGLEMGVGRVCMEGQIAAATGFELLVAIGDAVEVGQVLMRVHLGDLSLSEHGKNDLNRVFEFSTHQPNPPTELFMESIE